MLHAVRRVASSLGRQHLRPRARVAGAGRHGRWNVDRLLGAGESGNEFVRDPIFDRELQGPGKRPGREFGRGILRDADHDVHPSKSCEWSRSLHSDYRDEQHVRDFECVEPGPLEALLLRAYRTSISGRSGGGHDSLGLLDSTGQCGQGCRSLQLSCGERTCRSRVQHIWPCV